MTKDEAIDAAEAFVARKYRKLPQVVSIWHLTERQGRLFGETWIRMPGAARWHESARWWDESNAEAAGFGEVWRAAKAAAEREGLRIAGRWTVYFFMSFDTDALGMPPTLGVSIDDVDGAVTQVTPE
jgi:hypothetical protein